MANTGECLTLTEYAGFDAGMCVFVCLRVYGGCARVYMYAFECMDNSLKYDTTKTNTRKKCLIVLIYENKICVFL